MVISFYSSGRLSSAARLKICIAIRRLIVRNNLWDVECTDKLSPLCHFAPSLPPDVGEGNMTRGEWTCCRIRSWRSETAKVADGLGQRLIAVQTRFGTGPDCGSLRRWLANQLRAERARCWGDPAGYDLGRHAALVEALALLRAAGAHKKAPPGGPDGASRRTEVAVSGPCGDAAGRGPSAWRAASGQPRSSGRPSGSRPAGPTSRDSLPATDCTGCAGGASAT